MIGNDAVSPEPGTPSDQLPDKDQSPLAAVQLMVAGEAG